MGRFAAILKETVSQFLAERAPRMAAALAFYTTFSLAPLLIIIIAVAGLAYGQDAAQGKIVGEIQALVGVSGASTVQDLINNARKPATGAVAAVIGLVTLLVGATGVASELQDSLNTIWNVKAEATNGIVAILKQRLMSFAMILGIGFLLLVSLVLSAALTALTELAGHALTAPDLILHLADFLFSFAVITVLFALIYKIVPDAEIRWGDVWLGASAASLLFAVGKLALGFYIARSGVESAYGAAGSLVVLLLWVYYSAQILFLGAELTQVHTTSRRSVPAAPWAHKTVRLEKRNVLRHRPRAVGRD
jgi:membrane protein